MGSVVKNAFILTYTLVVASLASFGMLILIVLNPRRFFYRKERKMPPKVLQDGWNHAFISVSDVRLHYVYDGDESKPLMLFVHGFPEFWYSWRHQLREFKKDYRVVAIDMRGYGGSDKPRGVEAYDMSKLVNDIKETILALGYKSCTLVAHDWGGKVCYQVVLKYPELIDRFIAMNCSHPRAFREHLFGGSVRQLLKSWYMFFFQVPYLAELLILSRDLQILETMFKKGCKNPQAFSEDDIEAYKFTYSQPNALTSPINYYRRNTFRDNQAYSIVQPPTLIIWGTEDAALDKGLATLSAKYCAKVTLRFVEGAGHSVAMDAPAAVIKEMRTFLAT